MLSQAFPELRQRLEEMNIKTLHDLSEWTSNGRWAGWIDMELEHLNSEYHALISVMSTPVHYALKDDKCWGNSGCYTVKEGFKLVDGDYSNFNNDKKWKKIWNKGGLPKINVFFWILAHRKMLTTKNIRKRGMEGPLRYIL